MVIGVANTAEMALDHQLGSNPHLGLGLAAGLLYFSGVTKLSQSKHIAAIAITRSLAITGYVSIAAFLILAVNN